MENNKRVSLVYSGSKHFSESAEALNNMFNVVAVADNVLLEDHLNKMSLFSTPDVIMIEADDEELVFSLVEKIKSNPLTSGLIIILIGDRQDLKLKLRAIKAKVHDLYVHPYEVDVLNERLNFLIKFKLIKPNIEQLSVIKKRNEYHVPYPKRIFDMIASGAVLLVLSPILLLVAILIKLDSKGPVIYKSKRVGTGYRIFDFYKFRSMKVGADAELKNLSNLNQYADDGSGSNAFVKIKNDPRVTKLGNFLRNSSLDEIPQLFNVIKGDMSLVGNRPLPLYEAEMLTSNEWSLRFLGPSGLTGLWQISKRGKSEMSDTERKQLDNFYAKNYSVWFDLNIMLRTVPALFQKEKV
ncbi:sugar transferase [Pedobacter antarcticus]|uniref:Glycosyl transferase n=2 Tax=Pedobacter antarcticus TaxID=34086 RepID=A0A081PDS6_9SPHI|nr:sugar transferase [Pedobacter antarcticus]KEQ28849.1 glycosyl transferase [Pedobacter antarcticus 4BY]SDM27908.1 Sugar transferase involved in LPS biosynthesis (colanic, teichoic acid) [Pedobacter antarcticus]SFF20578.1 Sugar transferase involved in LPS biosynthesis (colanic, teichoic acid) [Pedobacter antarcticus]